MDKLLDGVQYVLNLGPTVILPIAILIIGMIFGTGFKKAFRSGITIGIGFVGINLVINLLVTNLGPAAQQMVERFGLNLTIIDAGWPSAAAASWASPVAAILIPICLIVNLLLIFFRITKTLDIDIWNYWHFIAAGATGYVVTGGNWWFAILCAILYEMAVLIIADKTAPMVERFYGLKGISMPTGSTAAFGAIGIPIGWVVGKIPGLRNLHADPESIQKRFGIFGEPMMMGLILGIGIGLLAGYDLGEVLQVGISMAAVMLLMPRMVKILMEGLIPISEAAREFMKSKFKGRELYIGLDAALSVGHPAVMSTALMLVPITLLLAVILPGNRVLPFGDLATIPFYIAFIVASRKGNIVQSLITGTIVIAFSLLMATNFADTHTAMMNGADFKMPDGATKVSSLDLGGNFLNWLILKFSEGYQAIFGK
ncbi:PTS galactitol transporter subunit IIC [Listeria newyorkensis]|uniref:PTS galactitol transporter subunit IIC n=1 Tax=Listeria newyorkensis TaxID=1497681 RepID=A0A841YUL5_9LIST|nr:MULTISPECIES: PTS transporter subunit IIC [Listeria]KGL46865.1 PTS system galactitol-specific transporter subunit IIC [Listeriaceae bacterium FSL A5-0209]KGL39265.1 PTS system galactitol-specific transporter subunit IIC [Listeria newyorkensis]KMT58118.1 PTS system galactitol-specific, IIC component [Listeria newyorkensis]MBC1456985.1 PTS galactitol transporter subunit IIC [Listeria newyorkensis]PNP91945.1 PTS galactitol transporter subunit IIC [Listeria newyorkensis]